MTNFDEFKEKAKDVLGTIADVSVEAYKIAEEKAKILAKSTKLSAEISRERSLIRRLYIEIGRAYYDLHKDNPGEAFEQNCDGISTALARIAARQKELDDLKKSCNLRDEDFADAGFDAAPDNDVDVEVEETHTDHSDRSPDDE